ncbi:MAG: amidase, partial [Candidatus Zixiibacteriota bacterium]
MVVAMLLLTAPAVSAQTDSLEVDTGMVARAEQLIGLKFTPSERDSMLDELQSNLDGYRALRGVTLENSVPPALTFSPLLPGMTVDTVQRPLRFSPLGTVKRPKHLDDLAFYTVRQLAELIRTRQVTSTELTQLCLKRMKKYDSDLHCVITLTEDLALRQAARADSEIAAGHYRGPLHGIPYGAKDLLATRGYPTTWGAMPYKDQVINTDATVIRKLQEAGAVLVAKLTLGALAWGDVWFGDTTRNPWNLQQGSSGSSAGPAAAVAAGLVPFAIGSE